MSKINGLEACDDHCWIEDEEVKSCPHCAKDWDGAFGPRKIVSIYDRVQNWYMRNGISTSQFFKDNSTEMGREEMMNDFASRMLSLHDK